MKWGYLIIILKEKISKERLPNYANFDQREYDEEEIEKYYYVNVDTYSTKPTPEQK